MSDSKSPATGRIERSEAEWQEVLTPEEYQVLRRGGTEAPYTGEYLDTMSPGTYACRACGGELFTAETKFMAHCGWPAFYAPAGDDRIRYIRDTSLGMERVEVRCAACDSHLGHVFEGEGYPTPTDQRYCINSICLDFRPADTGSAEQSTAQASQQSSGQTPA